MVKHDKKARRDKGRLPPFVPLLMDTLDTPAWRAMSHGARSLYTALKRHHRPTFNNNGRLYVSCRRASIELGSKTDYIVRWFRELQFYGFIVQTKSGYLGVEGSGLSPHWRLTELPTAEPDGSSKPATRDFLRWDGTKFRAAQKQNPVPQKRDTPVPQKGDTRWPNRPPKAGHTALPNRPPKAGHIYLPSGGGSDGF